MAESFIKSRGRLTTYEQWMVDEGIPIVEGHGNQDVRELKREPWKRTGAMIEYEDEDPQIRRDRFRDWLDSKCHRTIKKLGQEWRQ
jgi:hypothetical protein